MKEKDLAAVIGEVNEGFVEEAMEPRGRRRFLRLGVIAAAALLTVLLTVGWIAISRDLKKPAEVEMGAVRPPEIDPNAGIVLGSAYEALGSFTEMVGKAEHIVVGTVGNFVAENYFYSVFEVEVETSYSGNVPKTLLVACEGSSRLPFAGAKQTTLFTCGYRGLFLLKGMDDAAKETFGLADSDCYWIVGGEYGLFDLVSDGNELYVYSRGYPVGEELAKELKNYARDKELEGKLLEYLKANDLGLSAEDDYRFKFLFKLDDLAGKYLG